MHAFKFIGSGAIVRRFVRCFASGHSDTAFAIYAREAVPDFPIAENVQVLSIEDFIVDARPTLVCCSVNEEDILRKDKGDKNRSVVAGSNIKLLRSIIERGILNHGLCFVLTNPSEVVGQYVAERTGNPSVYSLGLSVDHARYRKILVQDGRRGADFQLAGNHWNRSFPVSDTGNAFSRRELDNLYTQFSSAVQKEFCGFRPPIQSGANAINHLVKAFVDQSSIPLSGPNRANGNFVGGIFCTRSRQFIPTEPKDPAAMSLYREILDYHESLMAEVSA